MEKNIIYWNPWWDKNYSEIDLVERERFDVLISLLKRKEIVFITGVRRSGKTSGLYYLVNYLIKNGTDPKNILYLNMDDDVLEQKKLEDIYQTYKKLHTDVKGKTYIFLDEIQNVNEWERWVKARYDSQEDVKFFISGSNAHLVKKKSASLLTGRMFSIEFYPLSFKEYLSFRNVKLDSKISLVKNENIIKSEFRKYLKFGGFPEVVLEKDERIKYLLLKNYFENIRDKDIIRSFGIKEIKKFERLSLFLISNCSRFISAKGLSPVIELSTSVINNYFDYSELVYLFLFLKNFSYSIKGQITSQRKAYSIDTGIVNATSFRFSEDYERLLENVVFIELKRKEKDAYYFKERYECDYVVKEGLNVTCAIQVTKSLEDRETRKREIRGLLEAMRKFDLKRGIILTDNEEENLLVNNHKIIVKPIWKWLIEQ